MRWTKPTMLAMAALVVGATVTASAQTPPRTEIVQIPTKLSAPKANFAAAAALPAADYDSKWIPDSGATTHATSVTHGFHASPRQVVILFSPGGEDSKVYPLDWSWYGGVAANPVTVEWTTEDVVLHIAGGYNLHGIYDGRTGQWQQYLHGYWRILAWK